jgi:hypothetical protein
MDILYTTSKALTPEELKTEVTNLAQKYRCDPERFHQRIDSLFSEQLKRLGYNEAVDYVNHCGITMWYS